MVSNLCNAIIRYLEAPAEINLGRAGSLEITFREGLRVVGFGELDRRCALGNVSDGFWSKSKQRSRAYSESEQGVREILYLDAAPVRPTCSLSSPVPIILTPPAFR
jgi:hypothetical protein